jgi:hypothetical protein
MTNTYMRIIFLNLSICKILSSKYTSTMIITLLPQNTLIRDDKNVIR